MIIKQGLLFDQQCYDLADAALEDEDGINTLHQIEDLSSDIKNTIKNWIERARLNQEPRETGDAWTGGFADNH